MLGGWEHDGLLAELGRHSLGKGCLYIKRLQDVDVVVLNKLIVAAVKHAKRMAQAGVRAQAASKK